MMGQEGVIQAVRVADIQGRMETEPISLCAGQFESVAVDDHGAAQCQRCGRVWRGCEGYDLAILPAHEEHDRGGT